MASLRCVSLPLSLVYIVHSYLFQIYCKTRLVTKAVTALVRLSTAVFVHTVATISALEAQIGVPAQAQAHTRATAAATVLRRLDQSGVGTMLPWVVFWLTGLQSEKGRDAIFAFVSSFLDVIAT